MHFEISGDYIELLKLLKASGLCGSGGEAKICIEEGKVFVDGVQEFRKRCKIVRGQKIEFNGEELSVE